MCFYGMAGLRGGGCLRGLAGLCRDRGMAGAAAVMHLYPRPAALMRLGRRGRGHLSSAFSHAGSGCFGNLRGPSCRSSFQSLFRNPALPGSCLCGFARRGAGRILI